MSSERNPHIVNLALFNENIKTRVCVVLFTGLLLGASLLSGGSLQDRLKTGIVTGRVLNPNGTPAAGYRVGLLEGPIKEESTASPALVSVGVTDVEGHYRLDSVPAGSYLLVAGPLDDLAYFPGVAVPSNAKPVKVDAGIELKGLDLRLPAFATIRGRVIREGHSAGRTITLISSRASLSSLIAAVGTFEFTGVRPGTYRVLVSPSIDTLPDQVMVGDADVLGLEIPIPLSAVTEATVHINMAGEPGGPLPAVMLRFNPVPRERSPETRSVEMLVPVRETSKSVPIPLGQYDITVLSQTTGTLPLGFFVKSIVAGSTDLMKQPLTVSTKSEPEIRVTIGAPSPPPWVKVSGRVTKLEGAKVKPTTITLSSTPPVSPDLTTTIHPDGGFEFPMVLPGNYSVRLAPQPDPILRNIVIDSAGKANIEIPLFVPLP